MPNPFQYLAFMLTRQKTEQIKLCFRKGILISQVIKFFNFFTYYNFPFPTLYNKEIRLASNMKGCREQYKKHTGSSIFPAPFSVTYVKPSMPSAFLHSIGLLAFGWGDLENSVALLPLMTNIVIEPTKHLDGLVKKFTSLLTPIFISFLHTKRMSKKVKE